MFKFYIDTIEQFFDIIKNCFIILLAFIFIGWYFDNVSPLKTVTVLQYDEIVEPGGYLEAVYDIEKNRTDCKLSISRYIIDSKNRLHSLEGDNIEEFSNLLEYVKISYVNIPKNLPEGQAQYYTNIVYNCNPIKTVSYTSEKLNIMVKKDG